MQIIQSIQNRIYEIRGERVMLDVDIAILYQVELPALEIAIKRKEALQAGSIFQLTEIEWKLIQPQATANRKMGEPLSPLLPLINDFKNCPYAFTAQGLLMVSTTLNADIAIQMHISLIRNYTAIQKVFCKNENPTTQEIQQHMGEYDAQLNQIYDAMENLLDEKVAQRKWEGRERIGFK